MIKGWLIFNIDINYISTSMYCLTRHKYLARVTMKLKKRRKKEEEKEKKKHHATFGWFVSERSVRDILFMVSYFSRRTKEFPRGRGKATKRSWRREKERERKREWFENNWMEEEIWNESSNGRGPWYFGRKERKAYFERTHRDTSSWETARGVAAPWRAREDAWRDSCEYGSVELFSSADTEPFCFPVHERNEWKRGI